MIAGLFYISDYLSSEAHDELMAAADREPWLMSVDHPVQVYGYRYNRAKETAFYIGDLPVWANDLAQQLWRDGLLPAIPEQLVVNDYPPGTGIFPHIDQAVFGDVVASVSLQSSCMMQFSHSESDQMEEVLLEPRSLLVLSGEARWLWKHAIAPRLIDIVQGQERPRSRRVSLTFRVMPESTKRPARASSSWHAGSSE